MITNGFHNWIANVLASNQNNLYMIIGSGSTGELMTNDISVFAGSTVIIKRLDNVNVEANKVTVSCRFETTDGNGKEWKDCGVILDTTGNNNIEGNVYPENIEGLILLNRLLTDPIKKENEISLKRTITFEL